MTLEDVNEGPLLDLEDAVFAHAGFGYAKHGYPDEFHNWQEATIHRLDHMSNSDFLRYISIGLESLMERQS